jgi:pyridinium-3,5-biscarboxylic acid mononucleotide sulfurtransferase
MDVIKLEDHAALRKLKEIILEKGSIMIAFSGGVDSTFLLAVAKEVLEDKVLAVTANSPVYPDEEIKFAEKFAKSIGVEHIIVPGVPVDSACFKDNPEDRCYHCKIQIFESLKNLASEKGIAAVVDATNTDDFSDYRPGLRAGEEKEVSRPLVEAGISKAMLRRLSQYMGLPNWDKPSQACLASRFPYNTSVTEQKIKQVKAAEKAVRKLGFDQVRVRYHGDVARLEVGEDDLNIIFRDDRIRAMVNRAIKDAGFLYSAVDLGGYRTGSMNDTIEDK